MLMPPFLSVVVAVYNEENTIAAILNLVLEIPFVLDVIVVDDASSDRTSTILQAFELEKRVTVITHDSNKGKGAAIRTAIPHVLGELLIVQDADLEYSPSDYLPLVLAIKEGHADVVFGSRRSQKRFSFRDLINPFYHGVTVLNLMVRVLYGLKISDEATCYKIFRVSDLKRMELECERFEFCPEVTAKSVRLNLKIKELPISYTPRSKSEGKKISLRDAFEAASTLWRFRNWSPTES